MKDPHETKIGIVSDSTRKGTSIVDTATEVWPQNFPPFHHLKYEHVNGIMVTTVKMRGLPVRIKAVVTSADWLVHTAKGEWEASGDYVPTPEQNPVGRRMCFECGGTFAELIPMDDETKAIFRNSYIVGLAWQCDVDSEDMFSLHLTCYAMPRR